MPMSPKIQKLFNLIAGELELSEARPPMSDERKRELIRKHRERIMRTKRRIQMDTEKSNFDRNRLGKLLTKKLAQ